jgi:hypothetical protein
MYEHPDSNKVEAFPTDFGLAIGEPAKRTPTVREVRKCQ